MSRINTASESFKARKILIFHQFSFYKLLKFHGVEHEKSFITSGPDGTLLSISEYFQMHFRLLLIMEVKTMKGVIMW